MNPPSAGVEAIFLEAIDKETPLERSAFLETACGTDHRLRRRVEALLRAHDQAGDFLATPLPERELVFPRDPNDTPVGPTPAEAGMRERHLINLLTPGQREGCLGMLGPYEVTGILGSGGMSVVFQAEDPRLNRVVALKVLSPELAADAVARQRFLREGQAAAALRHENVTAIHTIEDADPIPYLVMEFIDGESLQHLLDRSEPLPLPDIIQIGRQAAAGLGAAHAQGLIHRDIKPANILLDRARQVKITDFGLVRTVNEARITHPGLLAGTPRFMSPEQAQGQPVDPRSDLFSLGSVLYTLCAGRTPFQAETTLGTLRRICDGRPTPLADIRPDIPGWLVAVIDRLMEKTRTTGFSPPRRSRRPWRGRSSSRQPAGDRPPVSSSSRPSLSWRRRWGSSGPPGRWAGFLPGKVRSIPERQ
jgi:serine/threonine protein kinase